VKHYIQITNNTTKTLFNFDVSISIGDLHQKKLVQFF